MYTRPIVWPYTLGSQSGRALAGELSTIRVRPNGHYRFRPGHLIINWGNSSMPHWGGASVYAHMLNKPQNVKNASEKIKTFQLLQDNGLKDLIPEWTTSKSQACEWLKKSIYGPAKNAVVCRTLTRANSGRGIVLADTPDKVVAAPLYTRYKPKEEEYRVHVTARFGIIDVQEKRKKEGIAFDKDDQKYIRSHDNHWVFCRSNVQLPNNVRDAAERALMALGLDFAAIDIGFHSRFGIAIYELNTAPGIEGQTLISYTNVFRRYLQS